MANLNMSFTEAEVQEALTDRYELIPAGNYIAEINRSEIKENRTGSGNRLSLGFKIIDGEYAGRLVFQDITLRNTNPVAQKIGREQMAQLGHACGKRNIGDSTELHGIPIEIKVAIRQDKTGQYDDQNEIKKFSPASGGSASASAPAAPSAPPPSQPQSQPQTQQPVWARG